MVKIKETGNDLGFLKDSSERSTTAYSLMVDGFRRDFLAYAQSEKPLLASYSNSLPSP